MQKSQIKFRKCSTEGCRKEARENRKECRSCEHIRLRDKDPVKLSFQNLRKNARRRGKEFTLTLEQFREFCIKHPYIQGKGRTKDSYHIDRIDETKGYSIDNIQILTNAENFKKYVDYRWNGDKMEFTTKITVQNPIDDVPF